MGWFSGSKRALEHRALPASDAPRRQPRSRPGGTILGELHPLTETVAEQGVKRFSPILGTPPRIELPILLNWTLAGCREARSHGRAPEQSRTDNWSPTGVFLAFWRCYCDIHWYKRSGRRSTGLGADKSYSRSWANEIERAPKCSSLRVAASYVCHSSQILMV